MTIKNIFKSTALALTLLCNPALKPVVMKIDVMQHPETGQNIILFGDAHFDLPDKKATLEQQTQLLQFLKVLNVKSKGSMVCSIEDIKAEIPAKTIRELGADKVAGILETLGKSPHNFQPQKIIRDYPATISSGNFLIGFFTYKGTIKAVDHKGIETSPLFFCSMATALNGIDTYNAETCNRMNPFFIEGNISDNIQKQIKNPLTNQLTQLKKNPCTNQQLNTALEKLYDKALKNVDNVIHRARTLDHNNQQARIELFENSMMQFYILLDIELLQTVYMHPKTKNIVLYAGGAHTRRTKNILKSSGYQKIETFKNKSDTLTNLVIAIDNNIENEEKAIQEYCKQNNIPQDKDGSPLTTIALLDLEQALPKVMQLLEQPAVPKQPAIAQLKSRL